MNKFNYDFVVTLGKLLFPVGWFEILAKMNPFVVTGNDKLQFISQGRAFILQFGIKEKTTHLL